MAKQTINIGSLANDKTGDALRTAFGKVNANFTEVYTAIDTIPTDITDLTDSSGLLSTASRFVLVNVDGGVFGSGNGENWEGPFDTGLTGMQRVAVGPNMIVYIADNPVDDAFENLYYTTAWNIAPTLISDTDDANWNQVRYFASIDRFIAAGSIGGVPAIKYSGDGRTWTVVSLDTEWASILDDGNGYPSGSEFTDIGTNGTGFLISSSNSILGCFYTSDLLSLEVIGSNEWLNDANAFAELTYATSGDFTGWHATTDNNSTFYTDDITGLNFSSFFDNVGSIFADNIGYSPNWGEVVMGRYSGIDTLLIATSDGQVMYWPAVPEGPFVSIPKPYTVSITNITWNSETSQNLVTLSGTYTSGSIGELVTISGSSVEDYNGTYYWANGVLYIDSNRENVFDTSGLTAFTGTATLTWSHGKYIDALNYAGGKFYVANDDEEVFVSINGGETWTEVASLNPEGGSGEGGDGPGTGTDFMNDIDGYIAGSEITTGNFTFFGDIVYNSNGMTLVTDRGTLAIGTDMEFPGAPSHFHIAFLNSNSEIPTSDLFLGDDYNYFKVNAYANGVEIATNDRDQGEQNVWQFRTDGATVLPGALVLPIDSPAAGTFDPVQLTSLDITKQVQILTSDGTNNAYSLADGDEGQIMYFAPAGGVTGDIYVRIENARIVGEGFADVTNYSWAVFSGESLAPTTIAMAIFADGAWCLRGGNTD